MLARNFPPRGGAPAFFARLAAPASAYCIGPRGPGSREPRSPPSPGSPGLSSSCPLLGARSVRSRSYRRGDLLFPRAPGLSRPLAVALATGEIISQASWRMSAFRFS